MATRCRDSLAPRRSARRRPQRLPQLVRGHGGRIVKVMGDGVLIEFASAVNAVKAALEVQGKMAEANEPLPEIRRVSGKVHDEIRGKIEFAAEDMGEQTLKNIAGPVRVFNVGDSVAPTSGSASLPLPSKPSIAVLPFTNMSGDPEQQYFSDGITEDIITELSRSRGLFVIARNSSFSYRDKTVDVRRIARELGVRYIVQGSVRKMGSRIRITAQLIDAMSGNHVWSERFDRNIEELFDVQDELTQTIVTTMTGRLEDAEIRNASNKRTDSLSAYDCLLRGADLALSLLVEHDYGNAPDVIKQRALDAAQAAIRLDPRESRCHVYLGQVHRLRDEYDLAISHLERGLALNPNDALGMVYLSVVLGVSGRAEECIELLHRAIRLDPYQSFYWGALALNLYVLRRYEEALAACRKLGSNKTPWQMAREAACLAQLGRFDEARALAAEVLRRKSGFNLRTEMPHYKYPADADHLREGLLKAGLPE